MITKEYWLLIRSQPEIPVNLLFAYYQEMGGKVASIMEFQQLLWHYAKPQNITFTKNGEDRYFNVSYETYVHKMFRHYDEKFGTAYPFREAAASN